MESSTRKSRLQRFFGDVLSGRRQNIESNRDAQHFLEAAWSHADASRCIETVANSDAGMAAVRDAVRVDLSPAFMASYSLKFIRYLMDPSIKIIGGGLVLRSVLSTIVSPPTFWHSLQSHFLADEFSDDNELETIGWLMSELLSIPPRPGHADLALSIEEMYEHGNFKASASHKVREVGYKIQHALQSRRVSSPSSTTTSRHSAGGRHDNDFADFRRIAIYPTKDEFLSSAQPFYRAAEEAFEADVEDRMALHIDNQFRLLREDLLEELKADVRVAMGITKDTRKCQTLKGLKIAGVACGSHERPKKCTILAQCSQGLEGLTSLVDKDARLRRLKSTPNFLRHNSLCVLFSGDSIISFAFIDRDEARLSLATPIITIQLADIRSFGATLLSLKSRSDLQLAVVDTPAFAYEPVLRRLQNLAPLALHRHLVDTDHIDTFEPSRSIERLLDGVSSSSDGEVRIRHGKGRTTVIDESQRACLTDALTSSVSVVQGPPGTGKSFIGAEIVRCHHETTDQRILVLSYTNHALDQFLEDLLKVGIPEADIVRLGSKSSARTASLRLPTWITPSGRLNYGMIDMLKSSMAELADEIDESSNRLCANDISFDDLMEFLEFSETDSEFYNAFQMPEQDADFELVGSAGKTIGRAYLFQQWASGRAPVVQHLESPIWNQPMQTRREKLATWGLSIMGELAESLSEKVLQFDRKLQELETLYREHKVGLLRRKRVIGCTTTGAAMYADLLQEAEPDIVLVEEAGEILESHVLAALATSVKQLILIGDHKQLRPKVNKYALSVEAERGYDLNVSLFERLILQGKAHSTLAKQHRMRTAISKLPRLLTYPALLDAPSTLSRPRIKGLSDCVMFVNHAHKERSDDILRDRLDSTATKSRVNDFEAQMVLQIVRYLGQQGYRTCDMVVLTPYLGQLRHMQDLLKREVHTILNDLDSHELIRSGLLTDAAASVDKSPLRISTVDNYQGEESDIVIVSMTRSNDTGDIGFMKAAERLNVLVTRARDCLIMVGNLDTFTKSKKGTQTWLPFIRILKENGHLYDGLPVACERHKDKKAVLSKPEDFSKLCRDGGCDMPCLAALPCGVHKCPRRCHLISDHSRVACTEVVEVAEQLERRARRDLDMEERRQSRQAEYARKLQSIDDEIAHHQRWLKYDGEEKNNQQRLDSQAAQLAKLKKTVDEAQKADTAGSKAAQSSSTPRKAIISQTPSAARDEWNDLKQREGAQNGPLDELMEMVGLEDVKMELLSVKSKVDTAIRQGVSLASERFSCCMLGNPGTGKTTVARLYAQFLTSAGIIPGDEFEETTGAKLAHGGVAKCEQLVEKVRTAGGGVIFIDEAYQLVSGNSAGGSVVLDYLLPEVENLTGQVVFVLAGYNKQMESFFAYNPGLPSRFPIQLKFADYTDKELLGILELKMAKRFPKGNMKCEDGPQGLFCRIVARRVGYARGREGFGNARTVENALAGICKRQADRLRRERREKGESQVDHFLFTKEDLIGPEPMMALSRSPDWIKLQKLTGLREVKESVKALVDSIQENYHKELEEQPVISYNLNKVFLGNPGTGKTTVAKLYGGLLADLGLLSKREVVVKNPADFLGSVLGASEQKTQGILSSAVGKVLVIDEAYGLYDGGSSDPYKKGIIDTIVAEVQSVPGDDRCVLLLGYDEQMQDLMKMNPGLGRRFPIDDAFRFEDFDQAQLGDIFDLKLKALGFKATSPARKTALEMLDRARNRPHFGNGGEVDIILNAAKGRHQVRVTKTKCKHGLLSPEDFDPDFDRAGRSETNVDLLFRDTVGCEETIQLLKGYQQSAKRCKELGLNPKEVIPFNFLFRGPPGTGKTTTAKKLGKIFYDMGFLATAEVLEKSASDLVAGYVGQTSLKVRDLFDKALGKVLFIDEAYRLADGPFAKEAMDEIVDLVTKDRFRGKLVIVLAGYEKDINRLMAMNEGLTSRFPDVVEFRAMRPAECFALLTLALKSQREKLAAKSKANLEDLETPTQSFRETVEALFADLAKQPNWASARDVKLLVKQIWRSAVNAEGDRSLVVDEALVLSKMRDLVGERCARSTNVRTIPILEDQDASAAMAGFLDSSSTLAAPVIRTKQEAAPPPEAKSAEPPNDEHDDEDTSHPPSTVLATREKQTAPRKLTPVRDAGVSDAVWNQLQEDQKAEAAREASYQELERQQQEEAGEAERERLVKMLLEERRRRAEEMALKQKLMSLGRCPVGYEWIKQEGGYRCAGGSHWLSGEQVASL